ncbi:MAG TPA: Rrf2 family transcriptional regulator [Bacillota bacterium]|nr:Rrf2 family transcriptional regulator [Bacillota bacterium]
MKLSLRGEYALRALIALGESYDGEVVPMQAVSQQQEVPKRFLEQILNDLRAGGFVESKRGIAGGYRLARPADGITLAQVIRHIEGTLTAPSPDLSRKPPKLNAEAGGAQLAIRAVMKDVREAILKVLDGVTLADLCEQAHQLRDQRLATSPDYTI